MDELGIKELSDLLAAQKLSSVELVGEYISRVKLIDKAGPMLNSVIEVNPDVLEIAANLDAERLAGSVRSPIHGVPIFIKDNIDTADKMQTTAGSLALVNSRPKKDAHIVKRLRKAGAIILGKTNLSEWANFRSSHSSSGWSSRGGLTRNPYALDRSACGSSSGSAVAVAANLCAAAVGTETDGSIICPSHMNGIVGIKPTLGLVSRSGIIPIAHSQDTAGPMTRTVSDAALLLTILAGYDPQDRATKGLARADFIDYSAYQPSGGLVATRIGVARQFWGVDPNVDAIMEEVVHSLQKLGAVVVDPVEIPNSNKYDDSEYEVLLYEFKSDLNQYLAGLGENAPVRTLEEIIKFNQENKDRVMPHFGQERMIAAQAKGDLNEVSYRRALSRNRRYSDRKGLAMVFSEHQLDAVLIPSGCPAWLIDLINGDHYRGGTSSPAAVSGYPSITVPAGYIHGLPVGMSLIGLPYAEKKLIEMANSFENETRVRIPPKFLASVQ